MPLTQAQYSAPQLRGGTGFATLPAAGTPLAVSVMGVVVVTAGNMGLVLADGSNNDSNLIAVTAGMFFPFQAVAVSASNTAGVLGIY